MPPTSPQRWNRYAYSAGNPLIYVDPDGRDIEYELDGDRQIVEERAANNHRLRAVLNAFAPGTGRDLFVNRGDPGVHSNGTPRLASTETTRGRQPDSQEMIDAYENADGREAGTEAANAIWEAAANDLVKAVIVLGPDAGEGSILHELGHVEQAWLLAVEFREQADEAAAAATNEEYEESDSEKYAREFATYALKDKPDDPTE